MKHSKDISAKMKQFEQSDGVINLDYEPQPKQEKLHKCEKEIVLYGGAVGGGKSAALIIDATLYALTYPGARIALFRHTKQQAKSVFVDDGLQKFVPDNVWNFNHSTFSVEFINGSTIKILGISGESETKKFQGDAWNYLGIDEVTLFKEEVINFLMSRCRSPMRPDGAQYPRRIRLTANPGGVSHAYIKRLFIDREFLPGEEPSSYEFIPSFLFDNKYLVADEGYRKNLEGMPEHMRRRLLEGDWSVAEGTFLDQFSPDCSVVEPFNIPEEWPRFRALDYGYADETVVGWFAKSPVGRIYLYREYVCKKQTVAEIAQAIKELSRKERILATFADPAFFKALGVSNDPAKKSAAGIFRALGVPCIPANNNRKFGAMMMREHLTPEFSDSEKSSRLMIFSNCKYTLNTIPFLVVDPQDPDDILHRHGFKQSDHAYDMIRYFLTTVNTVSDSVPAVYEEERENIPTYQELHYKPFIRAIPEKKFDFIHPLSIVAGDANFRPNHTYVSPGGASPYQRDVRNKKIF